MYVDDTFTMFHESDIEEYTEHTPETTVETENEGELHTSSIRVLKPRKMNSKDHYL